MMMVSHMIYWTLILCAGEFDNLIYSVLVFNKEIITIGTGLTVSSGFKRSVENGNQ